MKNYVQSGGTVTLTAPAGGVVGGNAYLIGSLFVVAVFSAAASMPFAGKTIGVFELSKTTTTAGPTVTGRHNGRNNGRNNSARGPNQSHEREGDAASERNDSPAAVMPRFSVKPWSNSGASYPSQHRILRSARRAMSPPRISILIPKYCPSRIDCLTVEL